MKVGRFIFAAVGGMMIGCASKAPPPQTSAASTRNPVEAQPASYQLRYEESTASALVFDPPVAAGERPLELSRDLRGPSAFVGFDGPITTFFWIHTDDFQDSDWGGGGLNSPSNDRFQRRAIIDKTGVTYR